MTSDTEYTYSSGLIYLHIYFIYLLGLLYILVLHYKKVYFNNMESFLWSYVILTNIMATSKYVKNKTCERHQCSIF